MLLGTRLDPKCVQIKGNKNFKNIALFIKIEQLFDCIDTSIINQVSEKGGLWVRCESKKTKGCII